MQMRKNDIGRALHAAAEFCGRAGLPLRGSVGRQAWCAFPLFGGFVGVRRTGEKYSGMAILGLWRLLVLSHAPRGSVSWHIEVSGTVRHRSTGRGTRRPSPTHDAEGHNATVCSDSDITSGGRAEWRILKAGLLHDAVLIDLRVPESDDRPCQHKLWVEKDTSRHRSSAKHREM